MAARDGDWTVLPAAGRDGEAPEWPLDSALAREIDLWVAEWRRPQAVMWDLNGQQIEVALYVRSLVAAEQPTASVAARTLVRQQQEALGLSLPGLRLLRWRIAEGVAAASTPMAPVVEAPSSPTPVADSPSPRERLKLVRRGA